MSEDNVLTVGVGVGCVHCGYDLRGLRREGRCPECGRMIGDSLGAALLRLVVHRRVRRLQWGAVVYAGAMLMLLIPLLGAGRGMHGQDVELVLSATAIIAGCAVWAGVAMVAKRKLPEAMRAGGLIGLFAIITTIDGMLGYCSTLGWRDEITSLSYLLLAWSVPILTGLFMQHLAKCAGALSLHLVCVNGRLAAWGPLAGMAVMAVSRGELGILAVTVAIFWPVGYALAWTAAVGQCCRWNGTVWTRLRL